MAAHAMPRFAGAERGSSRVLHSQCMCLLARQALNCYSASHFIPRLQLLRLWTSLRITLTTVALVCIDLLLEQVYLGGELDVKAFFGLPTYRLNCYGHNNGIPNTKPSLARDQRVYALIAASCIAVALVFNHRVRGRVHRWLGARALGMDKEQEASAAMNLLQGKSPVESLDVARALFYALPLSCLTEEVFITSHAVETDPRPSTSKHSLVRHALLVLPHLLMRTMSKVGHSANDLRRRIAVGSASPHDLVRAPCQERGQESKEVGAAPPTQEEEHQEEEHQEEPPPVTVRAFFETGIDAFISHSHADSKAAKVGKLLEWGSRRREVPHLADGSPHLPQPDLLIWLDSACVSCSSHSYSLDED